MLAYTDLQYVVSCQVTNNSVEFAELQYRIFDDLQ